MHRHADQPAEKSEKIEALPPHAPPAIYSPTEGGVPHHHRALGEGTHRGHSGAEFQRRFWICLILTIPLLLLTPSIANAFGYTLPSGPLFHLVPLSLATIIFFYGGSVFLVGSFSELRQGTPGMMTLIALAISVAYAFSIATAFGFPGVPLYWELATLIDVMLFGHWMELRAIGRASSALTELARLLPDTAERVVEDRFETVPVASLRVGDVVLIRPGARAPADGTVVAGQSTVNESMITGESRPVAKGPGATIIGGTINQAGALRVRVTRIGADTTLAGIMRLVRQAQESRSRSQVLADRAAYWLTLIAIGSGTLTLVAWLTLGASVDFAIERTVTVLVIACPHALGLAIPLVVAISTTLAARDGILIRDRLALERARDLRVIVFDKTGTLTMGKEGLVGMITADGVSEAEAITLAAAAERESEHPIGRAIRNEATARHLPALPIERFHSVPGQGVRAEIAGAEIAVGGPMLIQSLGITLPESLRESSGQWGAEGKSVVYLLRDRVLLAAFALADLIRPESRLAVADLMAMGIQVVMLTGDSEDVARWVAHELGISEYFANVLPGQKAARIQDLEARGEQVGMVGDGVNDAPALVAADVGIAIGAGTDVAIESAGIILLRNDPRDVVAVIQLSRASYRKMIENLIWATGYNVIAIPLAAGVLAAFGLVLVPAIGALLMSASTIIVALNAQLLRRLKLTGAHAPTG